MRVLLIDVTLKEAHNGFAKCVTSGQVGHILHSAEQIYITLMELYFSKRKNIASWFTTLNAKEENF